MNAEIDTTRNAADDADDVLAHAFDVLQEWPEEALRLAGEVIAAVGEHPIAELITGIAQRKLKRTAEAVTTLEKLVRQLPEAGVVHLEYAHALASVGRGEAAVESLRRAAELNPDLPDIWRTLADHYSAMGDTEAADAAYSQHVRRAARNPALLRAAAALAANEIPTAEVLLRGYLQERPTDVAAIRMLAEVAARLGRFTDAETLLLRCLELAPGFVEARAHYALVLNRLNRPTEALDQIGSLLELQPENPNYRSLKALFLVSVGEYAQAIDLYSGLLREYPSQARVWLNYGHVLRTIGRQDESIQACRKCLALLPTFGQAWFTLSNLKTFEFSTADVTSMEAALQRVRDSADDELHLHFALGKAYEDLQQYDRSFRHYSHGNRIRRAQIQYRADRTTALVARSKALYTQEFFAERNGVGAAARDPIFVVGMPRAGSTLVDQILSSHSLVEGTMELSHLIDLARTLEASATTDGDEYPASLAALDGEQLRRLGDEYLRRSSAHRKSATPLFVDKMPNNWLHVGLIALALPNARIIDVRRHPLACCFSMFKQHFAKGQHFSYDLQDLGRYYRDYVELMDHIDRVLPGRVHRVHYEALVDDVEGEVRGLLTYCGLPFEDACLRFYENTRAVRTASSEQVRRPIFREGLEQWRRFEMWLDPLKTALGGVLDTYPSAPQRRAL